MQLPTPSQIPTSIAPSPQVLAPSPLALVPARAGSRRLNLPWPLPALLCWASAWLVWLPAQSLLGAPAALLVAAATGASLALCCSGRWRQVIAAAGFPLSAWALGLADGSSAAATALPAAAWLWMGLPLLLAYPVRAWRDAPFFPTPTTALMGLASHIDAPERVLDAGCGLGHGLRALRREWPQAQLVGLEWSAPLAAWTAWRCRCLPASVQRADMWAASWARFDLVYLFQRPESMARAWAKAQQEMAPGSWLVSLEFVVPELQPHASLQRLGARPVWLYQVQAGSRLSQ